ncbi:MAG TPA: hypothetical protein VFN57_18505 [Thermomicrobiaceae bacterium]|nr:hypothetical protein [Thermomicrobiaceae bacterium]
MAFVWRVVKAVGIALGVEVLALVLSPVLHVLALVFGTLSSGYVAGAVAGLGEVEAAIVGLSIGLLLAGVIVVAHIAFGIFGYLGPVTIAFFAVVTLVYGTVIVGATAWLGGRGHRA